MAVIPNEVEESQHWFLKDKEKERKRNAIEFERSGSDALAR